MNELWGGDMTSIAQHGLIWAQSMTINCLGPEATKCGTVKYISVPLGALYNQDGQASVTVRKLQAHVSRSEKFKGYITLKNAIV